MDSSRSVEHSQQQAFVEDKRGQMKIVVCHGLECGLCLARPSIVRDNERRAEMTGGKKREVGGLRNNRTCSQDVRKLARTGPSYLGAGDEKMFGKMG